MPFAIDLSPRQSTRTLEQAMRHRAEVLVEPRTWEEADPLSCRLEPAPETGSRREGGARLIVLSYEPSAENQTGPQPSIEQFCRLVGTYCDLAIRLGENIYLCSSDVVRVEITLSPTDPQRFVFDAAVCNKIPAGTEGRMIVGMQFQTDPQLATSLQMAEALRRRLWSRSILAGRASDEESK